MADNAERYDREQIGAAVNRAADLIQERLDSEGDSLAWDVANIMTSAIFHLLSSPDVSLADIFVEAFGADPEEPEIVMAEYGMD